MKKIMILMLSSYLPCILCPNQWQDAVARLQKLQSMLAKKGCLEEEQRLAQETLEKAFPVADPSHGDRKRKSTSQKLPSKYSEYVPQKLIRAEQERDEARREAEVALGLLRKAKAAKKEANKEAKKAFRAAIHAEEKAAKADVRAQAAEARAVSAESRLNSHALARAKLEALEAAEEAERQRDRAIRRSRAQVRCGPDLPTDLSL